MNKYVSGAYSLPIKLITGVSKMNLPDVPILRNKRIKHIDFCSSQFLPDIHEGSIITSAENKNLLFTFIEKNTQQELIQSLPADLLEPINNAGSRLYINKIIDFTRSYINLSGASQGNITGKYIYLVIWFDEPETWGMVHTNEKTSILPLEITLTGMKTPFKENILFAKRKIQNLILDFPSLTHTGNSGLDYGYSNNKFLTLSYRNNLFMYRVPLYLFYQRSHNYPLRLQNIRFDLQSSYIETLTTTVNDLKTVFFNAVIDDNK